MEDKRTISICIPTYNRVEMTIEAFYDVYEDKRISEIVIVDDASDLEVYEDLKSMTDFFPKVKLYRNLTNQDCYRNKMTAISYATNDWCILLDSDNKIDKTYLDVIFSFPEWPSKTILTPSFAKPTFDFRRYEGLIIGKNNIMSYIDMPLFETCLNACNYFVNRDEYLSVWDSRIDPVTSDSIYLISRWLEGGNNLYIVPSLHYEHKVHEGSHYKNNVHRTPTGFHESILNKLRNLK
jgi:glycosyltransferase involved in cell wall biosynthesis